ncbi:unnamed protein product [Bursaphelenchus xylophilus]|uniref:(pine wood nematode) hypothetical protein n=1 Tax=Bursaphelenchus xylophilus TaxID=6326 RepID=A0A1I7SEB3_BURXY|nr:unnamed protein product [Bursaphelenchus xylophilus]CAG9087422.1 unnamed protein product [Bursaphelenchus xylophilus]
MNRLASTHLLNRLFSPQTSKFRFYAAEPEYRGPKEMTLKLPSRRLDAVLKRTSNMGTTALEKSLARGLIRVNEEVCNKKAYNVEPGDVLELWLAPLKDNPNLAKAHYVEVVDFQIKPDNYHILVQVDKDLVVQNWRKDEM